MKYLNYTPHNIILNSGEVYSPEGTQSVRIVETYEPVGSTPEVYTIVKGPIANLPNPEVGVRLIVSAMVLRSSNRLDLVAPATGHKDAIRDSKGRIVSVPGFII